MKTSEQQKTNKKKQQKAWNVVWLKNTQQGRFVTLKTDNRKFITCTVLKVENVEKFHRGPYLL